MAKCATRTERRDSRRGRQFGIDGEVLAEAAGEIGNLAELGVQLRVVVGGGNFCRGRGVTTRGMDRVGTDHVGMWAKIMDVLALEQALRTLDMPVRVQSAIEVPK